MKEHLNSIKVELMVEKQVAKMANQGKIRKNDLIMARIKNWFLVLKNAIQNFL